MTPLQQVQRTKRGLGLVTTLTALSLGAGVTFGVLVAAMLLSLALPLPPGVRPAILPAAIAAGLATLILLLLAGRFRPLPR